jgi:hypothetical protein
MRIKKNIAVSESGFLFNPSTGDSFSVNPVGQDVIKLMKEEKSDEEIIDEILNTYMVDKNTVEKDLYDFKNVLESFKLIN